MTTAPVPVGLETAAVVTWPVTVGKGTETGVTDAVSEVVYGRAPVLTVAHGTVTVTVVSTVGMAGMHETVTVDPETTVVVVLLPYGVAVGAGTELAEEAGGEEGGEEAELSLDFTHAAASLV